MKNTVPVTIGFCVVAVLHLWAAGCGVPKARFNAQVARTTAMQSQLSQTRTALERARQGLRIARQEADTARQQAANALDAGAKIKRQLDKARAELAKRTPGGATPATPTKPAGRPGLAGPSGLSGPVNVKGNIDPAAVRKVIRAALPAIRACYTAALKKKPKLAGKLVVSFTISRKGRVSRAKVKASTLRHRKAERCIRKAAGRLRFPRPQKGKVKVNYPLTFTP